MKSMKSLPVFIAGVLGLAIGTAVAIAEECVQCYPCNYSDGATTGALLEHQCNWEPAVYLYRVGTAGGLVPTRRQYRMPPSSWTEWPRSRLSVSE